MIRAFGGDNGKSRFEFRGHEAPMDIDPRPADTPLQRSSSDPFVSPFAFNSQQPMGIINNEMEIDDAIESTTAVNNDENDQLQNNTHSTNEQLIQSEKQPSFVVNINSKRSKRAASSGGSGLWQTIRQLDLRTWMHLPAVIYQWAHLLYNILVLSFIAYLFVQTIRTLYADYQLKFQYFQQEIMAENELCGRQYRENKCFPETRVPAIAQQCIEWEKCMQRDPESIAGTKISASVLAEIVESFVQSLSYKTMLFLVILVLMSVFVKWILGGLVGQLSAAFGTSVVNSSATVQSPPPLVNNRRSMAIDQPRYQTLTPFRGTHHKFGESSHLQQQRRSRSLTPSRSSYRSPVGAFRHRQTVYHVSSYGNDEDEVDQYYGAQEESDYD